jgi:transposase
MRIKSLIQPLVGTENIVAYDLIKSPDDSIITLFARIPSREHSRCGICHKPCQGYDAGSEKRRWRARDVGNSKCFIEADCPRVFCPEHGVVSCWIPWARHKSRFTSNFEDRVAWLATQGSKKMVSELKRIDWHTVGNICARVYDELLAKAPSPFEHLVKIGIDETSYKKGHKYITVVVNHETKAVIWAGLGRDIKTLVQFFELLTPEQQASIKCVTADGARYIRTCIEMYCPNAERCVDPFHVVSWAQDVLDKLRRTAWEEAKSADKEKGDCSKPKNQPKASKYALLKNPENLTANQQDQLELLEKANPVLYRAYLLKEGLRLALKNGIETIESALGAWLSWAQRCRIPEFRELREKIKRHREAIIATARHGLSNARIEATNNKIKLIIRRSYGFRNTDSMIAMIMLCCSEVKPVLFG